MGSPPQIEMMGAPHSSTAFRHFSTGMTSRMVDSYSRMRPHPVQVRLQACRGSSIMTSGNLSFPSRRFLARYFVMVQVILKGNGITLPLSVTFSFAAERKASRPDPDKEIGPPLYGADIRSAPGSENKDCIDGTSDKTRAGSRYL